jgi:hypothetical protein
MGLALAFSLLVSAALPGSHVQAARGPGMMMPADVRPPIMDIRFTEKGEAVDLSPNRMTTRVSGAAATSGPDGPALQFQKLGDQVSVEANRGLGNLDQFLVDAWVRPDDLTTTHTIISTDQFILRLIEGKLEGLVRSRGDTWNSLQATDATLTGGTWYHVAFSFDGKRADLFVNGSPAASKAMNAVTAPDAMGASLGTNKGMQFMGAMNRVRIRRFPTGRDNLLLDVEFQGLQTRGNIWDDSGWAQKVEDHDVAIDGPAYFNGQSSYLKVAADAMNGNLQQFAVAIDFASRVAQGRQNLVESPTFSLFLDGDQLVASILNTDGVWQDQTRAKTQVGAENQALVTYDGTSVDIYLGGHLAATSKLDKEVMPADRPEIFIGTHPGLRWWYSGKLTYVKIWNAPKAGGSALADLTFDTGMSESYEARDVSAADGFRAGSQALAFNGKTSSVFAGLNSAVGDTFSAEAWVQPADSNGKQMIILQGGFSLYLNGTQLAATTQGVTGGTSTVISKQPVPADGKWHHVSFAFQQGMGTLYIDGNQDNSNQMVVPTSTSTRLVIGSDNGQQAFFRGLIDDTRLWPGILRPIWWWFNDLRIGSVELTQAIQTAWNTVPLVYGKKTAARVYVRTNGLVVGPVSVRAYAYQNGNPLPGSPQVFSLNWDANASAWAQYYGRPFPQRTQTFDSLNIPLPTAWVNPPSTSAPVNLYFEVNPFHAIHEWNYGNNWYFAAMRLNVVPTLYVKEVPLTIIKGANTYSTNYGDFAAAVPFMRRTYPVPTPNGVTLIPGPTLTVTANPATAAGWNTVWSAVTSAYYLAWQNPYYYWYGMIPQGAGGAYYGMGWLPGYTSIGMSGPLTPVYYGRDTTMAHEIGHNHGRPHASYDHGEGASGSPWPYPHGGIGDVGFDTLYMRALPPGNPAGTHFHDFMAYGYPRWVSIKGWNDLMAARQARPNPRWIFLPHLILTGFIRLDGGVEIGEVYQATTPTTARADVDSPYSVQVLDASGAVIATQKIDLVEGVHDLDGGNNNYDGWAFAESLTLKEGTKPAAFVIQKDGQPVARRDGSPNPPVVANVTVTQSRTGYAVSWQGSDADGSALTYALQYSTDGSNWMPVAVGLKQASYDLNGASLPGSDAARIRVLASDGFNTASADSATFAVAKKAPLVSIEAPDSMIAGRDLSAIGVATDFQDEVIPEQSKRWAIDGNAVGQGAELSLMSLTPGTHKITFTATNSQGLSASASVGITVSQGEVRAKPVATLIEMVIDNPVASVNKITVMLDQPPVIVDSRTLVPIRFIAEGLGSDVAWDGVKRQVTLTTETDVILLTIDSHDAYVNGQYKYLDVPPKIMNSRTVLPVRFVSENLGAQVFWDPDLRKVTVMK